MAPVRMQVGISLDTDSVAVLVELLQQVWDKATAPRVRSMNEQAQTIRSVDAARSNITPQDRSQPMLLRGQKPPDATLLLNSKEAARLLRMSTRNLYKLLASGRIPPPVRIGRAVRWNYQQIEAWVAKGCPSVD